MLRKLKKLPATKRKTIAEPIKLNLNLMPLTSPSLFQQAETKTDKKSEQTADRDLRRGMSLHFLNWNKIYDSLLIQFFSYSIQHLGLNSVRPPYSHGITDSHHEKDE